MSSAEVMKRLDATESDVETRISLINKVKYANPTCKYCSFNCICIFEKIWHWQAKVFVPAWGGRTGSCGSPTHRQHFLDRRPALSPCRRTATDLCVLI